jgi:hypothetical protein
MGELAPAFDYRNLTAELRRELAGGNLNAINYVSDLADFWLQSGEGREHSWEQQQAEVADNLYTAAVEVPLSMIGKPYSYSLYMGEDGGLYTTNGFSFSERLQETLANTSGQTPEWDLERAYYDYSNYQMISDKLARLAPGEVATFVELSPTPQTSGHISDETAAERGYWGADSFRIHRLRVGEDGSRTTEVTSLWLPGKELHSWADDQGYNLDGEEYAQRLDLQIMSLSGFLPEDELSDLVERASDYASDFEQVHGAVGDYLQAHVKPDVESWVKLQLAVESANLAQRMLKPDAASEPNLTLAKRLSMITAHKIAGWQVELKQAVEAAILGNLNLAERTAYAQLDTRAQTEYLFDQQEKILACGGKLEFDGTPREWKIIPAGIYTRALLSAYTELHDYNCGGCGRLITVDEFIDDPSIPVKCFCGYSNDC